MLQENIIYRKRAEAFASFFEPDGIKILPNAFSQNLAELLPTWIQRIMSAYNEKMISILCTLKSSWKSSCWHESETYEFLNEMGSLHIVKELVLRKWRRIEIVKNWEPKVKSVRIIPQQNCHSRRISVRALILNVILNSQVRCSM